MHAHAKSAYVPPSLRGITKSASSQASSQAWSSTKKTALKKEFAIEESAFPSLGDTVKRHSTHGTPISFSSAAAASNKLVEIAKEVKEEVLPGWVHIRRDKKGRGGIQYKYGKPILQEDSMEEKEDLLRSRIILKNRIDREQYDRDRDIERLGDLSEFYGQPTLVDIYKYHLEPIYIDDENSE